MFKVVLMCMCLTAVISNPIAPRQDVAVKPTAVLADYLLPTSTKPENYVVKLTPDFTTFTFDGEVTILIQAVEATNKITLHSRDITINPTDLKVTEDGSTTDLPLSFVVADKNDDKDFLVITLTNPLVAEKKYKISITYKGNLNDQMRGFYRSSYKTSAGVTKYLATTQFESTDARRAFPCYDEPGLKATFDITIVHDSAMNAISNTNGVPTVNGAITTTVFERTPIMSTYLVAFVVSDFTFVGPKGTLPQRVFSQKEHIDKGYGNYALDTGIKTLEALERYLAPNNFQISKMDQIAIPDFSAGAMENWGLVTYRIERLMVTPTTSTSNKEAIASVIAHEYAHQWFGNNVGPAWWKYIWLNEGFATYFGSYTTAEVETSWNMAEQFLIDSVHKSLRVDSSANTRAMTTDAASPSEISGLFDTIAYDKSGSVIRMMEHILGTIQFKAGLSKYQTDFAFKGATDLDLYKSLEPAAGTVNNLPEEVTFETVMKTWSDQEGHPVITVTRDYTGDKATVTQTRYLQSGETTSTIKYWVPLNWARPGNAFTATAPVQWLSPTAANLVISGITEASDFVIFNIQQTGYYRVNYDNDNWKLIADYLKSSEGKDVTKINILNRAQLVDDALSLAKSDHLDYSAALELVGYLEHEDAYLPWKAGDTGLTELNRLLKSSAEFVRFKNYVGDAVIKMYKRLTFTEKETEHVDRYARAIAIKWACLANVEDCREKAEELLSAYLGDSPKTVSEDLKSTVYCAALRGGNKELWDKLQAKYASDVDDRDIIVSALGCVEDIAIKKELLNDIVKTTPSLTEHKMSVLTAVYTSGAEGVDATLEFLHEKLPEVITLGGSTDQQKRSSLRNLFTGLANRITTEEENESFNNLLTHHKTAIEAVDTDESIVKSAKSAIESNIAWLKQHEKDINTWLYDNVRGAASVSVINSALLAASVFFVYYFRN